MTNKEHKQLVLEASKSILEEYKSGTHYCELSTCHLCINFYQKVRHLNNSCKDCPMEVFDKNCNCKGVGCYDRKCKMITQDSSYPDIEVYKAKINRVTDFYEKFIELVKKSKHCRLKTLSGNETLFAKKLKKLDEDVYLEHKKNINSKLK